MLQHMVKAQVLDLVLRGVNFLVGILKLRLDHKRRWVAKPAGGGMVGAGITALGFSVGDVAVLYLVSKNH